MFTGSEAKGAGLFRAVDDLAESVHAPAAEVAGKTKELLELGLTNQTQLTQTVRAIEDLQRVGLEGGARKIESLVERSLAAGHLVLGKGGAGASRALTGTGVSEAELAAQLGINPKQLEAELKAGKITVDEGLAAIDRAIIQGKVGELATKKFTVSDAFTDLHNSVRRLFQEQDTGPITGALHQLADDLHDGTAAAVGTQEAIQGVIDVVGSLIRGFDDVATTAAQDFKDIKETAGSAFDWIVAHDPTHSDAFNQDRLRKIHFGEHMMAQDAAYKKEHSAQATLQDLASSGASNTEIAKRAKRLGVEATLVDRPPEGATAKQLGAFREEISDYAGRSDPTGHPLHDMRTPTHQRKALHDLGADAGKALHEGAAGPQGLDAHSPSRKMFDLGVDAADGFTSGAAEGQRMTPGPTGGKSIQVHVDVGGIAMHGAIDAAELMPLLESQIADVFERVALELGA